MRNLFKVAKRFISLILIIVAAIAVVLTIYFAYQDMTSTDVKEYIVEKYDFGNFDVFTYKTTIYVYEEDANCNSLWLKECTDDKDLEKEVIYYTKGGIKFTVKSFKDGSFEDDYNG